MIISLGVVYSRQRDSGNNAASVSAWLLLLREFLGLDSFQFLEHIFYRRTEMQAVEFNATVENGVIPIPRRYKKSVSEKVRVIVLSDTNAEKPKKKKIYSIGIDMTGYKFNREEANGRR